MSYAPEVVCDNSGKWYGNALRFETREEAENSARDLAARWFAVTEYRAVESLHAVNYRYIGGVLEPVTG